MEIELNEEAVSSRRNNLRFNQMKLSTAIFLLISVICLYSCKTGMLVRFKNDTGYDMTSLTVHYDSIIKFDSIKDKETTEYVRVSYSFPYCWAIAVINNDTIKEIPIDYVGEPKFKTGRLTIRYRFFKDKNGDFPKNSFGDEVKVFDTRAKRWCFFNDIEYLYFWIRVKSILIGR